MFSLLADVWVCMILQFEQNIYLRCFVQVGAMISLRDIATACKALPLEMEFDTPRTDGLWKRFKNGMLFHLLNNSITLTEVWHYTILCRSETWVNWYVFAWVREMLLTQYLMLHLENNIWSRCYIQMNSKIKEKIWT